MTPFWPLETHVHCGYLCMKAVLIKCGEVTQSLQGHCMLWLHTPGIRKNGSLDQLDETEERTIHFFSHIRASARERETVSCEVCGSDHAWVSHTFPSLGGTVNTSCREAINASPGRWLGWLEHHPVSQKVLEFVSRSGHIPTLGVRSLVRHIQEATSLFLSLSPYFPFLSL